ncbi:MAG TPA: DUF1631 family protein, partial [Burkholderiaceae bacterium]|nr:DUF1631 family protein [Burkholderiaceae bacterium]
MSAPQAKGVGDEAIDAPPVDRRRRLELLEDCRELVLSRLGRVVAEALAGISDELTELALRETRRDAQQALLDAVSLVRSHRPEIELRFHDAFSEIFERRMRGESDAPQASQPQGGELSLVDDSEIGERLALDRLVQRSRSKLDPDEVLGVRARLGALVERDWFDEKGHPASPEAVFEALRRTLDQLKAKSDVRDALLRALEPHVSANLNDIYSSVNERLRSGQILPSIRARIVNAPDSRANPHADSGAASPARGEDYG